MSTVEAQWQVESSCVDWITCSGTNLVQARKLWWLAEEIGEQEAAEGRKRQGWGMKGLRGWQCGHVAWGARDELVVVRAGGRRAHEWWQRLSLASENISRLDLAVTARSATAAVHIAHDAFKSASGWRSRGGKGLKTSLITNSDGGSTAYLGSRLSDRMGRLYDKGVQDETDPPGIRWRWELEIKNESARTAAHRLLPHDPYEVTCESWVTGWFQERGATVPSQMGVYSGFSDAAQVTDDEKKLQYLETSIRPMIGRLLQSVDGERILKALGLGAVVHEYSRTRNASRN